MMLGVVTAVCANATHTISKPTQQRIELVPGMGVRGDAHSGETVQHLSRISRDPSQPNLRQVHLIHAELHEELEVLGFHLSPGQMGENITTQNIDLLSLPTATRLMIGEEAVVEVAGLRNPCSQLEEIQVGLMEATLDRDEDGRLIRKAGIMGVILVGGEVRSGDSITIELPPMPHRSLEPV